MEESHQEELEVLLTKRLIEQAEADEIRSVKPTAKEGSPLERGDAIAEVLPQKTADPTPEDTPETTTALDGAPTTFTKIEKSLASLGFFTPSSSRLKDQKVKRINFTREVSGKRVEVVAEIIPSALYGLPITADQDKYLALQEIITNILQSEGEVTNPIRFKSADLIRLMNRSTKTGKNYKEIGEWLDVMMSTTIFSQGTVYKAGEKRYAKDRFRVFDRAVSVGKELDDGSIADANYVWLSDWQLENINHNFLLPIDLETYRELKNHIAKALVPLLQIWLYASQKAGSFEKRYDELCEILTLQKYRTPSQILRQLKPSLDELTHYQYLEKWRIEKTTDRKAYKIILFHGPKFHRDRRKRLNQKSQTENPIVIAQSEPSEPSLPEPGRLETLATPTAVSTSGKDRSRGAKQGSVPKVTTNLSEVVSETDPSDDHLAAQDAAPTVLDELVARGLVPSATMNLLKTLSAERLDRVQDYIEYWDTAKMTNNVGPAFLYDLIKNGQPLPPGFKTNRQRAAEKAAAQRKHQLEMAKQSLEIAYTHYQGEVLDRYIAEELPADQYEQLLQVYRRQMSKQGTFFEKYQNKPAFENMVRNAVRAEIRKMINVLPFEEFCRQEAPGILAEYGIDPAAFGIATASASNQAETEQLE